MCMYSETDVLTLIRDGVDHPATGRELVQLLRIPREARATFKRHVRSLVASGALVEIHGDRVVVRVERRRDAERAEGRIIRILERGSSRIVGRYDVDPMGQGYVVP